MNLYVEPSKNLKKLLQYHSVCMSFVVAKLKTFIALEINPQFFFKKNFLLTAVSRENILLYVKINFFSYKMKKFPKKLPCLHYTTSPKTDVPLTANVL